ncbi:MAG: gluconate 2-dehydrogenase subunit 3 family protein [Vicinamibacterales bacterium]
MAAVSRRDALRLMAAGPVAAGFSFTAVEVAAAHEARQAARAAAPGAPYVPTFFSAHEYETVRLLADTILPADERSGSASDLGVPEFIDALMLDEPATPMESRRQTAMRGGLAWLDRECQRRFDKTFVACAAPERSAVLDDIAWPVPDPPPDAPPAVPDLAPGRTFFFSFRDLTASGFWTTKAGMADLQFMGNRAVADWNGCPDEAVAQLGLDPATGRPKAGV